MTHFKQRMAVEITAERLRYLLHYDPDSGIFRWRVSTSNRAPVGSLAGTMSRGYCLINIDGIKYVASNLAWLYVTGEWPTTGIDHRDQDSTNDKWENLRLADQSQNCANSRTHSNNTSGYRGVSWNKKRQKWRAYIAFNQRQYECGFFDSIEEASEARDAKAIILHGEFARLNSMEIPNA
jgi:hypothetical protein